jgi:hypothetical protein
VHIIKIFKDFPAPFLPALPYNWLQFLLISTIFLSTFERSISIMSFSIAAAQKEAMIMLFIAEMNCNLKFLLLDEHKLFTEQAWASRVPALSAFKLGLTLQHP